MKHRNIPLLLLQVCVCLIFLGRAYQHLFWDAPFRAFFWNESLLKPVVENWFGGNWKTYSTSLTTDSWIEFFKHAVGFMYLLMGVGALFVQKLSKKSAVFLPIGSMCLIILSLLYCREKFFHVGQFFEYTAQFTAPLLLYLWCKTRLYRERLIQLGLIACALTFVCHGLYAVGYYPRPGTFVDMTISSLHVDEATAHLILQIAGYLDFVVALLIFIPQTQKVALLYMVFWGFLTAFARVYAYFIPSLAIDTLSQWWFETAFRLIHGGLPLFVYLVKRNAK